MSPLNTFIVLLSVHFVADFMFQTHWQASNKSKSNDALARHVSTYTLCLAVAAIPIFGFATAGPFVAVNGILHFVTDYFTSRASSKLYAKQEWHNFFVVIGFDQLIHQSTLVATMQLLT